MSTTNEKVVLVCLFHDNAPAQAAVQDLVQAGIPRAEIFELGGPDRVGTAAEGSEIGADIGRFNLPQRDIDILTEGVDAGGTLVAVETSEDQSNVVQSIFERHQATQVDEKSMNSAPVALARSGSSDSAGVQVIPVMEEELAVGKREVETGRARIFTRVIEKPVEETIKLKEEHATIERRPVNRPVADNDVNAFREQSIEINETVEEAVVSKTARVVEEVLVGKEAAERTEHISDSVRKTKVEVEKMGQEPRV